MQTWWLTFELGTYSGSFNLDVAISRSALVASTGYGLNVIACVDRNTDGDAVVDRLDTDSDGDACFDAYEAGTVGSNIAEVAGAVGANGFADSLETAVDSGIELTSANTNYVLNDQVSVCSAEICGDGLDNDADGYVDSYDSDCAAAACSQVSPGTPLSFAIQTEWSSTKANFQPGKLPLVGDIDNDGTPEIVVESLGEVYVYKGDGSDSTLSTPLITGIKNDVNAKTFIALGDIDDDGTAEIAAYGADDHIYIFDHTGATPPRPLPTNPMSHQITWPWVLL